ncbi:hypothetical protein FISHEDRAFT_30452, partial [Fistulina hepatica ATCC 64428]
LPSVKDIPFCCDADGVSIWRLVLRAEKAASDELQQRGQHQTARYADNLIAVRVLGRLMLDFWNYSSSFCSGLNLYHRINLEIKLCYGAKSTDGDTEKAKQNAEHRAVFQLGLYYMNFLLRVFRSNAGPIPTPSTHPSRPSMDVHRQRIIERMAEAPKSKADVKEQALIRDGYKCTVTQSYDMDVCYRLPDLMENVIAAKACTTVTQCAHLFSESAQDGNKVISLCLAFPFLMILQAPECAGNAFAMMEMFGLTQQIENLLGGQVNGLHNVLTMDLGLHSLFDSFKFWLEPVPGEDNTYDMHSFRKNWLRLYVNVPKDLRVTFAVDPAVEAECRAKNIPVPALPSRDLIALRASCARVANISGAVEYFERILYDREATAVMANDGSTAGLLASLL